MFPFFRIKYPQYRKYNAHFYFCDAAGETKVGAILRFLLFGSSSDVVSTDGSDDDLSPSLFNVVDVGVSGGVPKGAAAEPVDEIDGFRFIPGYGDEVTIVGWTNVDVGEEAGRAAVGICEILGVVEAKPDNVAMEEEEFDRVGLVARAEGVGKDGFEDVEGEGRE